MKKNSVRLSKIPLKGFIDMLVHLYNEGAEYVDILGDVAPQQDVINILVRQEYIGKREGDLAGGQVPLSDEMINRLIE
jgi:hypothetical protein